MDSPGSAATNRIIFLHTALWLLLCLPSPAAGDDLPADVRLISRVKQLYADQRWEDVVQLAHASATQPAELDYYRGMALARLQCWEEAKQSFEVGRKKAPQDKRFPLELAGIAFKQENFTEAKHNLQRALQLDPEESYGNNFLATIYFLEGNLEAAVKYWNRIGKPRIEEIKTVPQPRLDPVLLDRAFLFSPASILGREELLATQARVKHLDVFSRHQFELLPREDETFDLLFRSHERTGWRESKLVSLLSLLRGVPYQTIYPEFYNLNRSAANFVSLLRWDAQKRRVFAAFAAPLGRSPEWRYQFSADARKENWEIREPFEGSVSVVGSLVLQKIEAGVELVSRLDARWGWRSSVHGSHRKFANAGFARAGAAPFFTNGPALKYQLRLDYSLLRIPERRLTVNSAAIVQLGRMFARPSKTFSKLEGLVDARWLPRARGEDYELNARFRAGKTLGQVPFDELFIFARERDNDLWLRGHIGTHRGKKGSGPLGRDFFLANAELDKIIYEHVAFQVKLGPFLDTGRIYDDSGVFGSRKWLWDVGAQCKLRLFGRVSLVASYGRDLRFGRNAFYATVSR